MTNGKYIWPFVTPTTRRQLTRCTGHRKTFGVMISTRISVLLSIPMFVLMLVCVTFDLELVPSLWSKHFLYKQNQQPAVLVYANKL
jgi:hypothetical protein